MIPPEESFTASESSEKIWAEISEKHSEIAKVKQELNDAVEAYATCKSYLSQLSAKWVKYPLWHRIVIGTVSTITLIMFSLTLHLYLLLTASLVTLALMSVFCYLLSDHAGQTQLSTAPFKEIISKLTNLLASLIKLFDTLHLQFEEEIKVITQENKKFGLEIKQLKGEVIDLNKTIDALKKIPLELEKTIEQTQQSTQKIEHVANEYKFQLDELQKTHQQTKSKLDETQNSLLLSEQRLKEITEQFKLTSQQYERNLNFLKNSLATFQNMIFMGKTQQEQFKNKLQSMLNKDDLTMQQINEELSSTASKLTNTAYKFDQTIDGIKDLTRQQEEMMAQIDQLVETASYTRESDSSRFAVSAQALKQTSIFTKIQMGSSTTEETPPLSLEPAFH
ncbi:MAG: hypothetical protein QM652_01200 [Legionella sp.]|uniref:hypothetical protein n=1 Tax=Legionella sp. TaxID=459 RepID=UPI0039E71BD4